MAAWLCTVCSTVFSVGAPCCPHCGSTKHVEQGAEDMPKITRHGGPTVAGATVVAGGWSNEGDPDVWPGPERVDEESSPSSEAAEPGPAPDYEAQTVEELKEQLAERGLPKSGKRDELVQRLRDDDAAAETE
jgi:hypothetical protein